MPAKDRSISHRFGGGWATDFGTIADLVPDGSGGVLFPFLLRAENVFYKLDGSIRKFGGTSKYNSTVLESGDAVRGIFEYIRSGTAGSPARKRVCHVGTKVLSDDNDGTFSALFTGLEDDKVPNYSVFNDTLIIASNSTVDVPKTWDQSTAASLSGSPPNFSFAVPHVNRLWAAGDAANPSRLYYSGLLDETDWNGATNSGVIDVEPDDGDVITGIYPFRGVLFVFKGPNFGSIHTISGRTPSTFARDVFANGVGAAYQNLIFPFRNDVGFVGSDGVIRSLRATDKSGDFEQSSLSLPINTWIRDMVNTQTLKTGWAATDESRGYAIITVPINSSAFPNAAIGMDYRSDPVRFFYLSAFDSYSVSRMSDASSQDRPIIYMGGSDGFIRKTNQPTRSIDGSGSYSSYARTPFTHYGSPERSKVVQYVGLGTNVVGSSTLDLSLKTDMGSVSIDVDLISAGDVLGSSDSNEFTLDTSTLAEDAYQTIWTDVIDSGDFRSVSYEISNGTVNEDFDLDHIYAVIETSTNPNYEN